MKKVIKTILNAIGFVLICILITAYILTLIKGDSKESINKGPIALDIMNVEQFREHVKLLFKCDRVLLDYTEEEDETENKD